MRRSMRRLASAFVSLSFAGGCCSTSPTADYGASVGGWSRHSSNHVPGVCGAHGEEVPITGPYAFNPPSNPWAAQRMMSASPIPLNMLPPGMLGMPGMPGPMPGMMPPPGMAGMPPGMPGMSPGMPGMMPGMMPPNNGIMRAAYSVPPAARAGMGAVASASQGAFSGVRFDAPRTQIRFARPTGMKVSWFTQGPDGMPSFSTVPVQSPGRYNFAQGAIYRLKISNIEGRPGLEVYPTMEVVPSNPKTEAFLAHSSVPVDFTTEDFKQIVEGNYVVKVIYLPDPQFQDITSSGTEEILSTRLEPGVDPIAEAMRRGSILLVVRMGNVDQEAPNTPPLSATSPGGQMPPMSAYGPQYPAPPGAMVPFGAMPPGMPGAIGIPPQGFGPGGPMGPAGPGGMRSPIGSNPALGAGPMTMPPTASAPNGPGTLPNFGNAGSMPPPQLGPLFTPPQGVREMPPTPGIPVSNPNPANPSSSSNSVIVPNMTTPPAMPPTGIPMGPNFDDSAPPSAFQRNETPAPPVGDIGPAFSGPTLTPPMR